MIELNLLPEEFKKKKKKIELPKVPLIPFFIGFICLLVALQLILSGLGFINRRKLEGLSEVWQDLEPEQKRIANIRRNTASLRQKTEAIESLIQERLIWSKVLSELSRSMAANIWLSELTYDEIIESQIVQTARSIRTRTAKDKVMTIHQKIRLLTISGSAVGRSEEATAYVARFIQSLKGNTEFSEDLEDVELVSMKNDMVAGQEVMNFTLLCRYKKEEIDV